MAKLWTLVVVFLLTSVVSVTESISLITIPVMIQFGVEPHIAVATNMFALIFLSAGGLTPFLKSGMVLRHELPLMTILTIECSYKAAREVLPLFFGQGVSFSQFNRRVHHACVPAHRVGCVS